MQALCQLWSEKYLSNFCLSLTLPDWSRIVVLQSRWKFFFWNFDVVTFSFQIQLCDDGGSNVFLVDQNWMKIMHNTTRAGSSHSLAAPSWAENHSVRLGAARSLWLFSVQLEENIQLKNWKIGIFSLFPLYFSLYFHFFKVCKWYFFFLK